MWTLPKTRFLFVIFLALPLLSNCGLKKLSVTAIEPNAGSNTDSPNVPASGFSIQKIDPLSVQLGTTTHVALVINSASNFQGDVALTVEADEIQTMDPIGAVSFSVTPAQIHLTNNSQARATIQIHAETMAPDFDSHFHVKARQVGSTSNPFRSETVAHLVVRAEYEVRLMGGTPEVWSSPQDVTFRPHSNGVLVRFVNYDQTDTHVIHSQGPIPHGDIDNPLIKATATLPGGKYEYTVTTPNQAVDTYYCHLHETGAANSRTMTFNKKNPQATFASLNANVFQPKCVSCHGTDGGVTLSSYTEVMKHLVSGEPLSSLLYDVVDNGTMPNGGAKLTATERQALYDWIEAGAPNN